MTLPERSDIWVPPLKASGDGASVTSVGEWDGRGLFWIGWLKFSFKKVSKAILPRSFHLYDNIWQEKFSLHLGIWDSSRNKLSH